MRRAAWDLMARFGHVRTSRTVAVVICLALLAAACGGADAGDDPTGPDTDATTTEGDAAPERADADLVIWADEVRAEALAMTAAAFGEENGVTVVIQPVPQDLQTGFITANAAGAGPDVVVGGHDWIGNLVLNGSIDPVDLSAADQAKYVRIAIEGVTFNERVYGLPLSFESLALYRNTNFAPAEPATVEELVATGTSSGAENPLCQQIGELGDVDHMLPFYSSAGGYIFGTSGSGDYDPTDLGVGQAGSLTAATKISELGAAGVLNTSITEDNSVALFAQGRCAYLLADQAALVDVRSSGIPYVLSPAPGFEGLAAAQPFTDVRTLFVASKATSKELAASFVLDAANTPETLQALYEAEALPPAMTDVLAAVAATDPDTGVFAAAAAAGQIRPPIPQLAVAVDPLGKAQSAIVDGADPESTMVTAGATIADNLR